MIDERVWQLMICETPMRRRSKQVLGIVIMTLIAITVLGCGEVKLVVRNRHMNDALDATLTNKSNAELKIWHEFLGHWPNAKQEKGFVWREANQRFEGNVAAAALIEERYVLKLILDFEMSADFQRVTFPKVRLTFYRVKELIVPPEGPAQGGYTIMRDDNQNWFGANEWNQLVRSGWNFSAIGINVVSNAPVPFLRDVPGL